MILIRTRRKKLPYVGRRTLTIPWANQPAPDWVRNTRGMTFQGTNTVALPTSILLQAVTLSAELEALHPEVLLAKISSHIDSGFAYPPEQSTWEMAGASVMLHPLWISPAAIRQMSPGQQIDDDPITGFKMTFQGFEGFYAAVVEEGPLEQTTFLFDVNSGMLMGFRGRRPTADGDGEVQTQNWLIALR